MNKFDKIVLDKLAKEDDYKTWDGFVVDDDEFGGPSEDIERAVALARQEMLKEIDKNIALLERNFKNDVSEKTIRIEAKLSILKKLRSFLQENEKVGNK